MNARFVRDVLFRRISVTFAVLCSLLVVAMAAALYVRSCPALRAQSLARILFTSDWAPENGQFGLLAYLAGTVSVTLLAMVFAVPVSLLAAIYLSEYAPRPIRAAVQSLIDLLSGIPSVVYGVCGVLVVVPLVGRLAGACGVRGRPCSPVVGIGLVERSLADEVLVQQAARALKIEAGLGKLCLGQRDAGAAGCRLSVGLARVDAGQHLALLHPVTGIHQDLRHGAGKLGGDRRLVDGLDDRIGSIDLVNIAQDDLDPGGRRPVGRGAIVGQRPGWYCQAEPRGYECRTGKPPPERSCREPWRASRRCGHARMPPWPFTS